MGELRDRMVRLMGVKRYAKRTEEAYLGAVRSPAGHYHRSPDQITREEIREYLSHLVVDRHLAWSSCNQAAAALRLFYGQVLRWEQTDFYVPAVRKPQRLPEIFNRQELEALFEAAPEGRPYAVPYLDY
jgi:site-specific recombinase XerD